MGSDGNLANLHPNPRAREGAPPPLPPPRHNGTSRTSGQAKTLAGNGATRTVSESPALEAISWPQPGLARACMAYSVAKTHGYSRSLPPFMILKAMRHLGKCSRTPRREIGGVKACASPPRTA